MKKIVDDERLIYKVCCLYYQDDMNQKEIGEYLNLKTAQIDSLISIKQSKIAKLTEYRKALIYEYVTGKKEVV